MKVIHQARIKRAKTRILHTSVITLAALGFNVPSSPLSSLEMSRPHLAQQSPAIETIGIPTRITIASIGVDAAIERVALESDGSMAVPKVTDNSGWYELGPRPGGIGSAVIAGHVNTKSGTAAVFANLHKLKAGDKVIIQDDNGTSVTFVVRESRDYDPAADTVGIFSSNDGKTHLNIITCSGVWDKSAKQYSKRLVVFTEREH